MRLAVKSDSGFFMTEAVQAELRHMALPHAFDMSTWDSDLNSALVAVEDVDDEKVNQQITDREKAEAEAQRKIAEAAVQRVLNWAANYRPVGPLDYGTPRTTPLPPIEWYTGHFPSYKGA